MSLGWKGDDALCFFGVRWRLGRWSSLGPALIVRPLPPNHLTLASQEGKAGFGTPSSIQCSPSVKAAYSIVRRCTGSLGGNGAGGAIYGEVRGSAYRSRGRVENASTAVPLIRLGMPVPNHHSSRRAACRRWWT